jgi:hypothetical protein
VVIVDPQQDTGLNHNVPPWGDPEFTLRPCLRRGRQMVSTAHPALGPEGVEKDLGRRLGLAVTRRVCLPCRWLAPTYAVLDDRNRCVNDPALPVGPDHFTACPRIHPPVRQEPPSKGAFKMSHKDGRVTGGRCMFLHTIKHTQRHRFKRMSDRAQEPSS